MMNLSLLSFDQKFSTIFRPRVDHLRLLPMLQEGEGSRADVMAYPVVCAQSLEGQWSQFHTARNFPPEKYSPKKFVTLRICRFRLFGPEGNFSTFLRKSLTLKSCSSWKIDIQRGNLIKVLITHQELPLAAQLSGARPLGAPQAAGVISWVPPQVLPINCQNL